MSEPTDDEREALIALKLVAFPKRMGDGYASVIVRNNDEAADIVLAAGFRRQGPVTDAEVEAAHSAYIATVFSQPGRPAMRAALEAARKVQ